MKSVLLFIGSLLTSHLLLAQTTEFPGYFKLGPNAPVVKIVTVPGCPQPYTSPAGAAGTVTDVSSLSSGGNPITLESTISSPASSVNINADKKLEIKWYPGSNGDANLYVEEKDKTVLYVNYGLNPKHTIPKGSDIEEFEVTFDCTGNPASTAVAGSRKTLGSDLEVRLYKVDPSTTKGAAETTAEWFKNSNCIKVYDAGGNVIRYYVNRYDQDGKYKLKLKNREYIPYNHKSLDLGALVIPFKYRFGYKKDSIEVKDDVVAGINIGAYAGYKITRSSLRNRKNTYTPTSIASLRIGAFLNLSSTTLDSITTTAGPEPMKGKSSQNIAVLSGGLGLMVDVRGLQVGVYGGWDFGLGGVARSWNYHGRRWLGFGLGVKLTDLFSKKD